MAQKSYPRPYVPLPVVEAKKTLEHGGQQYEVDKIYDLVDAGMNEKQAILSIYKTIPKESLNSLILKLRKNPYYMARKDVSLAIIKEKGPELQQNLISIALEGRSERNRLDATIDALDRVYGKAEEDAIAPPNMVFNFSFNQTKDPARVIDRIHEKVVEGEVIDDIAFDE